MAELNLQLDVPCSAYGALADLLKVIGGNPSVKEPVPSPGDCIEAPPDAPIQGIKATNAPTPPCGDTPPPPAPPQGNDTPPPPPSQGNEPPPVYAPPLGNDTPPPPNTNVELDSAGIPWDARIHASTRTKTVKETWKYKKGAKDIIASVEAELRGLRETPQGTTDAPPAITPDELATQITTMVATGKIPYEKVMAVLAANGITVMADVRNHADKAAKIYGEICSIQ